MPSFVQGRVVHVLAALLAGVTLLGCASTAHSATGIEPLLQDVTERNAIGDQVALSKWDSGKPVLDAVREASVLASVRAQAQVQGMEADDAAKFFGMLIESNKLVQYQLLDRWNLRGRAPDQPRPDLVALRVRLDQLQGQLLDELQASASLRQMPDCPTATARAVQVYALQRKLDQVHRTALVRSLGDFCD